VAEGVESERTVALLEDLGCGVGQGFLFSRALPFERFEAWLAGLSVPTPIEPVYEEPAIAHQGEPVAEDGIAEGRWLRVVP
jgi:predicted signal transduction protein with EAL and GGDEF domain